MGIRTRLIAAATAGLMLTAALSTVTVSAAPASPATSAPSAEKKPADHDALLAKVAASLHVKVKQLTTALANLKQALAKGTGKSAAIAAFAKELKVGVAQAEKALQQLSGAKPDPGKDKPGVPPAAVQLLAAELHISADRARRVFEDLAKVTARGEAIVKDPAFVAIAKGLGITSQRLLDVLRKVKQTIGKGESKPDDKAPGGSPAK